MTACNSPSGESAEVGQTSVSFARCKLKEVAKTAELTTPQIQRSQIDDNLSKQPRVKRTRLRSDRHVERTNSSGQSASASSSDAV